MARRDLRLRYVRPIHGGRGFTLLEVVLVVTLITAMTAMVVPVYQSFEAQNDLEVAMYTAAQSLRRAQTLSRASAGDMRWGVFMNAGQLVIFRGDSFTLRDPEFDEFFEVSSSIDFSGLTEMVFKKLSGAPQDVGKIIFTNALGQSKSIDINEKGTVSF